MNRYGNSHQIPIRKLIKSFSKYHREEIVKFARSIEKIKVEQSDTIDDLNAVRERVNVDDMYSDIILENRSKVETS